MKDILRQLQDLTTLSLIQMTPHLMTSTKGKGQTLEVGAQPEIGLDIFKDDICVMWMDFILNTWWFERTYFYLVPSAKETTYASLFFSLFDYGSFLV